VIDKESLETLVQEAVKKGRERQPYRIFSIIDMYPK
jgi:hypothetical protein